MSSDEYDDYLSCFDSCTCDDSCLTAYFDCNTTCSTEYDNYMATITNSD